LSVKYDIVKSVKHLSVEVLERCAMRELSELEMRRIEKHVTVCPNCLDRLEGEMAWLVAIRSASGTGPRHGIRVSTGRVHVGGLYDFSYFIIDLGPAHGVHLVLTGTGLRSALENVQARIAGIDVPVEYAGPHDEYARVDQVNLKLPRSLTRRGGAVWN
jgi:hypothetical protein